MLNDVGLLILRVVIGLYLAGHGAQKLFGWFEGSGMEKLTSGLGTMGLRPAPFWAFMAGISEFGGGVLTALGLLSPLGPLGIIAAMIMANIVSHRGKGLWAAKGGRELPLTYLAAALALAFTGPGVYALDPALGIVLPEPLTLWGGLLLVILGVVVALLGRARQEVPAGQAGRGPT
jgi:putative oxidoreductase